MKMSNNKKLGNDFEKEFTKFLRDNGFWAYNVPNKINGQPFDIVAAKGYSFYAFECKYCTGDNFYLNRIEDNQILALKEFDKKEIHNCFFIFKFESDEEFHFMRGGGILEYLKNGEKSIKKDLMLDQAFFESLHCR